MGHHREPLDFENSLKFITLGLKIGSISLMLNFSILFLSTVTAGTPDSDSQLYRRIPEDSFSSSGSNERMLTNFVGKRGDLVSDIRIGKRSRQDADCYKGGMGFDHDYYRTTVGTLDR